MHKSQTRMARLFLGTCSSALPGAHTRYDIDFTTELIASQVINNNVLFYEKVADMFEVTASILPPYQQIYTICKQRLHGAQIDAEDERLAMLMSYAFSDLIKLCLDIYRIFCRNVESKSCSHRILGIFWQRRSRRVTLHIVVLANTGLLGYGHAIPHERTLYETWAVMLTSTRFRIASCDEHLHNVHAMATIRLSFRTA
jgi:hypothetical protein